MKFNFQPILPKKPIFDTAKFDALVQQATRTTVDDIHADYQKTVKTWTHKPKFYTTRRGADWYIGTKDEIYGYVENGTPEHDIPMKSGGPMLAYFKTGFKSKTLVNYIGSLPGATANRNFRRRKVVNHPGTKARNFSKEIAEKRMKQFAKLVRQAIRESKA